jgi:penicillin-binding protein 1A
VFVGFAGDLVVGVWVGRDDDKSLGKISGGTVPARVWHDFMSSAVVIDRHRGPPLPAYYRSSPRPQPQQTRPARHPSPLPDEWSEGTKPLRDLAKRLHEMFEDR